MQSKVWFDGSYNWTKRTASGGCVIDHNGIRTTRTWDFGKTTMNGCEFLALIHSIKLARSIGATNLAIMGDSKIVINTVNRRWKPRKPHTKAWVREAQTLLAAVKFDLRWVPRLQNPADEYSRLVAAVNDMDELCLSIFE